jgi:hypothetical protein
MNGIENGIKREPMQFFDFGYPSSITTRWVTVPLTSVNSLPISLKVSIMLILVTQIRKMCLTHPMVDVVSVAFGFACPIWRLQFLASMRTRDPKMTAFFLLLLNSAPIGLKSPLLHIFNLSLSTGTFLYPKTRISYSFLFSRPATSIL